MVTQYPGAACHFSSVQIYHSGYVVCVILLLTPTQVNSELYICLSIIKTVKLLCNNLESGMQLRLRFLAFWMRAEAASLSVD